MRRSTACSGATQSRRLPAAVLAGALVATLATGCSVFKPKDDFYGTIKNARDLRVYSWNPAKHSEVHQMDPTDIFSCYLKGSEEYEFKAWLHDSTLTDDFRARVNQVSEDAQVNNLHVDWVWVIGGPFMACVQPVDGSESAMLGVSIQLTKVEGTRPLSPPPPLKIVSRAELERTLADFRLEGVTRSNPTTSSAKSR